MDLAVQKREEKSLSALRREGFIPAELYGKGVDNVHLAVEAKTLRKTAKEAGESTVINLHIGKEKKPALIHDIQRDSLTGEIMHVDFYLVRMDEKITAHVQLEFTGESPAVKEQGGLLNKSQSEIEVEALPGDLPHSIIVDISSLTELNQSLYIKDLKAPKGVEILVAPETVIATVTPPKEEEIVEQPAADLANVVVESEEKKAEREKDKEEAGA